jgi:hypothetical protein
MTTLERKTSLAVTIKSVDKGEARVRFSTPDGMTPDKDRDVTGPAALTEGAQVVVSPFGHRSVWDGATPAGRATIHRDGTADLTFFLDTPTGQETFRTLKGLGPIAQYSYGFHIREEGELTPAMLAAGARRYLKRLDVIELSPVIEGAGLNTGTLALKSCGCGAGSTCGCTTKQPSRAEREAIVAESLRILAKGDALLAAAEAARIAAQLAHARKALNLLPEVQVDYERREWAKAVVAWASARWGVHPPRIKWTGRDALGSWAGVHYGNSGEVWLGSHLQEQVAVARVAIHETCHHARECHRIDNTEHEVELDTASLLRTLYTEGIR